jgi:predicted O-methyltransferase YrrM
VTFDIQPTDRVLDVGSGGYSLPHATVLADRYAQPSEHLQGALVRNGKPLIVADSSTQSIMTRNRTIVKKDSDMIRKAAKLIRRIFGQEELLLEMASMREVLLQHLDRDYAQIEALFSTLQLLRLNAPLPRMRDWAISPDFANLMIGVLRECKPKLVLELGSGVSTLIAGYVVNEFGGRVITLEHSKQFAEVSVREVRRHRLEQSVTVSWAPLKEVRLLDRNFLWYDTTDLITGPIGLLLVDGPPGDLQELSRYPAVPLLREYLSRTAVILLDDAARDDEKTIIGLWQQDLNLDCEYVPTENGAAVLRIQCS